MRYLLWTLIITCGIFSGIAAGVGIFWLDGWTRAGLLVLAFGVVPMIGAQAVRLLDDA